MSNSLAGLEAAELTDLEAARLAHQIASERFLPVQARHYEAYLARAARNTNVGDYDRSGLDAVWRTLLNEAVREVEVIRDPVLIRRLQERGRVGLAAFLGFDGETP